EVQNVEGDDVAAPDLAEKIFDRDFDVVKEDRGGGTAANTHLLFFVAGIDAGKGALNQKGTKLLAADFGEHRVHAGLAAVGDPHLLPVEDVMGPVFGEVGAGFGGEGIGSGLRLGKAVSAHQFGAGKLAEILLL